MNEEFRPISIEPDDIVIELPTSEFKMKWSFYKTQYILIFNVFNICYPPISTQYFILRDQIGI